MTKREMAGYLVGVLVLMLCLSWVVFNNPNNPKAKGEIIEVVFVSKDLDDSVNDAAREMSDITGKGPTWLKGSISVEFEGVLYEFDVSVVNPIDYRKANSLSEGQVMYVDMLKDGTLKWLPVSLWGTV